jgi:peptide chain release factor
LDGKNAQNSWVWFDSVVWQEFPSRNRPPMPLPTQIDERLTAMGWRLSEVDERFIRGTGPGGQKINKTSSTVWLQHRPTGIEVRCQRERSQAANRAAAWEELCAKLELRAQAEVAAKQNERERNSRRHRQKSPAQKRRMIESKKHRAGIKGQRGRIGSE